ncbi:hypothetical protein NQZ68_007677 [Dissostichus eleginoides]|nr:hypothetical protein NQZ68_007677 [Dissostichus eleginoides]
MDALFFERSDCTEHLESSGDEYYTHSTENVRLGLKAEQESGNNIKQPSSCKGAFCSRLGRTAELLVVLLWVVLGIACQGYPHAQRKQSRGSVANAMGLSVL